MTYGQNSNPHFIRKHMQKLLELIQIKMFVAVLIVVELHYMQKDSAATVITGREIMAETRHTRIPNRAKTP